MESKGAVIDGIESGSIADELEIKRGDRILAINGEAFTDILEYRFLTADDYVEIEIEDTSGEVTVYEIEKEYGEDLGILFEGMIDDAKSCCNKCIFCFIDQLPKGMRESLYFKDDDTRLSFLQGNFVTLTNLKEEDIRRIVKYRISPINVSIHTTNMELRKKMLNNRFADRLMDYLQIFCAGGIEIKGQIVLCPGVNDGLELQRTIDDMAALYPCVSCMAIVPLGLTRHREGLPNMYPFDREGARRVIALVSAAQKRMQERYGTNFVHLSDEFYCIAEQTLPPYAAYEDFSQLENGVGLIRLFEENVRQDLTKWVEEMTEELCLNKKTNVCGTFVTGEYAYSTLQWAAELINAHYSDVSLSAMAVKNDWFGPLVKVAGLLTGHDIVAQLKGRELGEYIFITDSMLKADEKILLDDMTLEELSSALGVRVLICREDGSDLIAQVRECLKAVS